MTLFYILLFCLLGSVMFVGLAMAAAFLYFTSLEVGTILLIHWVHHG